MAQSASSRRLSMQDASFLYTEKPNLPMHVCGVSIYEGQLTLEDVTQATAERLHLMPNYRQKVVFPPFGINHPTWEDDPDFNIHNHISEVTLPAPGNDRQLAEAASRIFAPALDRNRPLWKTVVFRGYETGDTPILSISHHCMIDGVSGVDLSFVTHDLTPDAPPPPPAPPWTPAPAKNALTLMEEAVRDLMTDAARTWTDDTFRQFRPTEMAERTRLINAATTTMMPYLQQPAPRTHFNGTVSAERTVGWLDVNFTEVRGIRSVLGGTVNDVVLAIVSGGLGRYLRKHNFRTDGVELRAMVPVSMRRPEQHGDLGNQVSMMLAPLYVGVNDPVERLNLERAAMNRLKEQGQAQSVFAMMDMSRSTPVPFQIMSAQADVQNTLFNTVSTNVPGPQVPLYFRGHKMLHGFGFGTLSPNIGMFVAIGSYNQILTFSITADPRQVSDIWTCIDCFRDAYDELLEAAKKAGLATTLPVTVERRQQREPVKAG